MKVLISDIDGTLYFEDKKEKITQIDIESIKKFQSEGHLFGICTGRSYSGAKLAFETFDIKLDFMILASGAVILNEKEETIKKLTIKKDIAQQIYRHISPSSSEIQFTLSSDNYFYFKGPIDFSSSDAVRFNDFSEINEEEFTTFAFGFNNLKELENINKILNDNFGDYISTHRNKNCLDISRKDCCKGTAIVELMKSLNTNENDIHVIGDSYNDIPMFKITANSYTFRDSPTVVKDNANHLVDSVSECINIILS